jgi:hypothetical protein
MKLLAVVAALFAAAFSSPAFALQTWQGDVFIVAVTPACESDGITANSFYRGVLRPGGLENNGSNTNFSLVSSRNAQHYSFLPYQLQSGSGSYQATGINSVASLGKWTGTFSNATRGPILISSVTPTIVFKLTINNYGGVTNCTATLKGSLGNRPGL